MFRDYGDSSNYLSDKVRSISIHDSFNNLYQKVISKNKKTNISININFNNNIINDSNLYLKYYNEIRDIIFGKNVKEDDNISFIHKEMIKRVKELIKLESTHKINKLKELESPHKIKFTSENQLSFFKFKMCNTSNFINSIIFSFFVIFITIIIYFNPATYMQIFIVEFFFIFNFFFIFF